MEHLSLSFDPSLPWWLIAVLAGCAALLSGYAFWRRARGTLWRAFAFALVVLMLVEPTMVAEQRRPLDDVALVVVDRSASQGIEPRTDQTDAALARLRGRLAELPNTEVRVVETEGRLDGDTGEGGTNLFRAIGGALAELPRQQVGAVFVVSDGVIEDVPSSPAALAVDAPVHLLRTGRPDEYDRRLQVVEAPSYGIVGKPVTLKIRVDDLPAGHVAAGPPPEVTLRVDGREVLRRPVTPGAEEELGFTLDRRGTAVVEMQVAALPGELTTVNNRAVAMINGVRDRLRVLLVSGEPHPGERAWRNILKSDPAVDLVHFTILRPPEKQDGTPIRELSLIAFPARELFELKLSEFDLVIFDRYRRQGVLPSLYLDNIARYVEAGGAVLDAAGPEYAGPFSLYRSPLGRILPGVPTGRVMVEAFKPEVTETGRRHPVTAGLPGLPAPGGEQPPGWGPWFRQVELTGGDTETVMSGPGREPLLLLSRVGKGRVAQLASDQIWLWSRHYEGGGPYAELVRRIAHWLMKEPDLEEEDLQASVEEGVLVVRRQSLEDVRPPVTVTLPDGSSRELALQPLHGGLSEARLAVTQPGLYEVTDGTRTALAALGALNPQEFRAPLATDGRMKPLVEASGGGLIHLAADGVPSLRKVRADRDREGRGWLGVVSRGAYQVTGVERLPLLPPLLALVLALGLLLMAWRREGR